MKLSDIRGDRTLDVIADIIDPIANIAEDDEAAALFKREKLPDGMNAKKFLLHRAKKAAPALLKGHKDDIIVILSTIEGVDPQKYRETLNLVKLIKDCTDLLTDEAFGVLFISAQSEEGGDFYGSAPENTEEQRTQERLEGTLLPD